MDYFCRIPFGVHNEIHDGFHGGIPCGITGEILSVNPDGIPSGIHVRIPGTSLVSHCW